MNFNSHTDVVIRVAVQLVNLLTPGDDRGRRYQPPEGDERTAAAAAVLQASGGREPTWEEAAELCFVAAELRRVFEAVSAGAIDEAAGQVNTLLMRTGARPELERHDGQSWHLHFHAADNSLPNGWAAAARPAWRWSSAVTCTTGSASAPLQGATGCTWTPRATVPAGTAPRRARTGSRPLPSGPARPDRAEVHTRRVPGGSG